jgi:formiminoglutamase
MEYHQTMLLSDHSYPHFNVYSQADIEGLVNKRPGETKLGEHVHTIPEEHPVSYLAELPGRFVLLGIPEDIGVRANGGIGGTQSLWVPALKAILNRQYKDDTGSLTVLGAFNFERWMDHSLEETSMALRQRVAQIDDAVFPVIEEIVKAGKVPIVIGGGHNNAYPILKGASGVREAPVNCINLDAHSDYRPMEGRHSGNGFRYARNEGYLSRYAVIGLHEAYNSIEILRDLEADPDLHYSFYEEIFLKESQTFHDAVAAAITHTKGQPTGIELDLDCIAGVLSSAATPSGITVLQARQYLHWCSQSVDVAYLHITEGAVQLRDGREDGSTAKLIAYLVGDFLRG